MPISLKKVANVDGQYGIDYFEKNMRNGDVVYVLFGQENLFYAIDVYFEKTGVLAKRRLQQ